MTEFPRREKIDEEFTQINLGPEKSLVYNQEISHLLTKKNREDFLELIKLAKTKNGKTAEKDGNKIVLIGLNPTQGRGGSSHYYRASMDENDYFIKEVSVKQLKDYGGGAGEIRAMIKAKELLKDFPDVEIMDYQLGYQGNRKTFLIAKYNQVLETNMGEYLDSLEDNKELEKMLLLKHRVEEIAKILRPYFFEIKYQNMAYDEKTDKVIIFDLMEKPPRGETGTIKVD